MILREFAERGGEGQMSGPCGHLQPMTQQQRAGRHGGAEWRHCVYLHVNCSVLLPVEVCSATRRTRIIINDINAL